MNRRDFILAGSAAAMSAGCATAARTAPSVAGAGEYHVFSKMFQPPVTKSIEELCALMKDAGFDGIQWTVRRKGHVEPENARRELPRLCKIAESFGLRNRTICTDITADGIGLPGVSPYGEEILRVAADCGIAQYRPAYYFYDEKGESFRQSLERIRGGFAKLEALSSRTGVRTSYQNHSSWKPTLFGGLVWDVYTCIRDLDPRLIGLEYDPMHALYETSQSWVHGFELVAPWIGAFDLKDFRYAPDPKNPKRARKAMVGAGEGIVPWADVRRLAALHGVKVPYVLHFEHKFDTTDLPKAVKGELDAFRRVFG